VAPTAPTILLVDDDREILESLKDLLEIEYPQVRILTALSGEAALKLAASEKPHVIVSDYKMPGMNGVEFLRRSRGVDPSAARLMMSAYADTTVAAQAVKEAEVALLVTKPFQLDYFVQLIGTLLKQHAPPK